MKLKSVVLVCAVMLVLASCAQIDDIQGDYSNTRWVNVYYASAEAGNREEIIRAEKCEIPQGDLEKNVYAIYAQSLREPISNSLKSSIPRGAELNSVKINDGTVTLDLSREYGNTDSFSRSIADYCLTMSLCELEGIRDVTILVEGAVSDGRNSENLTPDDVILADLNLVGFRKKLKLYFPDTAYNSLSLELRDTVSNGIESEALLVMQALVEGPSQRGLCGVVAYGTQVLSVNMLGDTCVVDFSSEFTENPLPGEKAEKMCVRAIAKSLSEIHGIEKMQILVNGATIEDFAYADISRPLVIEEYIK